MVPGLSEHATFEHLNSARVELAKLLPPQSDKILRALQHVELAMQYHAIDSESDEVLYAVRVALRALNQIERLSELPPLVSFAVNQATGELASILKAIRAAGNSKTSASGSEKRTAPAAPAPDQASPERRAPGPDSQHYAGPRRRHDDDTMDGLECLNEDLVLLGES